MQTNPKVSILMITYNQEDYIAQAINSVLAQQTNFDVEIIIGDDCSTDRTTDVLRDYQARFPDKIKLLLHPKNLGSGGKYNFLSTLAICKGKFVALLEGDDYWTDPFKLQKQVNFLENHPECVICAHNALVMDQTSGLFIREFCSHDQREINDIEDLLERNFLNTATVMFRNGLLVDIPEWFFSIPVTDILVFILLAQYGKIGYIDEIMSVYRIQPNGFWSRMTVQDRFTVQMQIYQTLYNYFGKDYRLKIRKAIFKTIERAAMVLVDQENRSGVQQDNIYANARILLEKLISLSPLLKIENLILRMTYWSSVQMELGYQAYMNGNFQTAVYFLLLSLLNKPSRFYSRGYWSIFINSLFFGRNKWKIR